MDSEIGVRGKGHPEISSRAPDRRAENGVGNYRIILAHEVIDEKSNEIPPAAPA
jgi:hypothetical protein